MSTVQEIQSAIRNLSPRDLAELRAWWESIGADAWDQQIEEAATNGKLDTLYERLQAENAGQEEVSLEDFLQEESQRNPSQRSDR